MLETSSIYSALYRLSIFPCQDSCKLADPIKPPIMEDSQRGKQLMRLPVNDPSETRMRRREEVAGINLQRPLPKGDSPRGTRTRKMNNDVSRLRERARLSGTTKVQPLVGNVQTVRSVHTVFG